MKINNKLSKTLLLTATSVFLFMLSCERDIAELEPATFPTTGEVFIDGFSAGLNYSAFGGSKLDAFDVDTEVKFAGEASMKFEVPDAGSPEGSYAGGVYSTSVGRDLSGYDALTFWAKATQSANIGEFGFGSNVGSRNSIVTITNVPINTNWKKFIIPIPDPSVLTSEQGMFFYAEGPENEKGYTFWVDEVKFEKLGTLAHPKAFLFGGEERPASAATGDSISIDDLTMSFNLPNGVDQFMSVASGYFTFSSSNPSVATITNAGNVLVLEEGEAVITGKVGDIDAEGALVIGSTGEPVFPATAAPTPTISQDSVISMFSNAYEDVTVDTWNPFWEFSTTLNEDIKIGNDDVKRYKQLNFVGILTESAPIDASKMTHFHIDIWTPDATDPPAAFKIKLVDYGANQVFDGGDDSEYELTFTSPTISTGNWVSLDIPLTDFVGLTNRNNIAQLVLSGDLPNLFVDNVYYYIGEDGGTADIPAAPTPTVDQSNVISLFSNAYDDVPVDTWSAEWDQAGVADIQIEGDDVKLYTGLAFAGIEFTSQTIDISAMENFHMDFFTPDPTAAPAVFKIKLVDFGEDGMFETGVVEHEITLDATTNPAIATGSWVSIDIPLADFTGLTNKTNLAQLIISGDPNTVYIDNVYFYSGGGSMSGTEPDEAAPNPTQNAANVISLFSDAYDDVPVDTWRTDWSNTDFEDIAIMGNATKKYANLTFAGIETVMNQIDATDMTHFRIDVWSADFTTFKIKLVDFEEDGEFATGVVEHELIFETPAQGQWVSYDIPLSDFTGLTKKANIAQLILSGEPGGSTTVFVDNVYFYSEETTGGLTEPDMPAPAPTQAETDVISLFSDTYSDVPVDTWRTDWSSADFEDVDIMGNANKKYTNLAFVGIETVNNQVDASEMTHFRLDVWSADFTTFKIKLVDFQEDGLFETGIVEHELIFETPAQGQWVSYDIPLADFVGLTKKANIAQLILSAEPAGASTIFVDNIYFYKEETTGGLTEPDVPAPTPTLDAANVISMFSDAYDDVPVDTWRTDWSSADFEDVSIMGNATKKYSNLTFVGIETVANQIDATGMTHIHIDVWSPDFTLFKIKLVDFQEDGLFETGIVEHEIIFDAPQQGGWISYDIPLSDFVNLTKTGNIAQLILSGEPVGANTIFVDNIYFHN